MTTSPSTTAPTTGPLVDDVTSIAEEVWRSFLGQEDPWYAAPVTLDDHPMSATVTVTGGWEGMVTIAMSAAAADLVVRRMLGHPDGDPVSPADVADAVGELVNMVGGGIKSLMPGPSTLSLPVVSSGLVSQSSHDVEVSRVELLWAEQPVVISVYAKEAR